MSELPLIGFLNLYKDFWDRLGANIAIARKKCMAKGCFDVQKALFWREINTFCRS